MARSTSEAVTSLRYGTSTGPATSARKPQPSRAFQCFDAAKLEPVTHPAEVQTIYRLLSVEAWRAAESAGSFIGSAHDLRDGFIHFSTAEQVAETAARHYAGARDLLLIGVSVAALGSALRFEPSRGGALFPHLYGALALSAVTRVEPLELDANGLHLLPNLHGSSW